MSAKYGHGVEDVKDWILSKLPTGPAYYPKVFRKEDIPVSIFSVILQELTFIICSSNRPSLLILHTIWTWSSSFLQSSIGYSTPLSLSPKKRKKKGQGQNLCEQHIILCWNLSLQWGCHSIWPNLNYKLMEIIWILFCSWKSFLSLQFTLLKAILGTLLNLLPNWFHLPFLKQM